VTGCTSADLYNLLHPLPPHNQSIKGAHKTEKLFHISNKAASLQPHKQMSKGIDYFDVVFSPKTVMKTRISFLINF